MHTCAICQKNPATVSYVMADGSIIRVCLSCA